MVTPVSPIHTSGIIGSGRGKRRKPPRASATETSTRSRARLLPAKLPGCRPQHLEQVQLPLQTVPPVSLRLHRRPLTTVCHLLLLQPGKPFVCPLRFSRKLLDFTLQPANLTRRKHPERIGVRLGPERRILVGAAETGPRRGEAQGIGHLLTDWARHHSRGFSQVGAGYSEGIVVQREHSLEPRHGAEREPGSCGGQSAHHGAALHGSFLSGRLF